MEDKIVILDQCIVTILTMVEVKPQNLSLDTILKVKMLIREFTTLDLDNPINTDQLDTIILTSLVRV